MIGEPDLPVDEDARSRSASYYLVEGPLVDRLRTTLALVARSMDFPLSMINILDHDTQTTISSTAVESLPRIDREDALCDTVVRRRRALMIPDARVDPDFSDVPVVRRGEVVAYLGVPLVGRESLVIGSLCVVDDQPRTITSEQSERLTQFAAVVQDQLDLIRRLAERHTRSSLQTTELARAIRSGVIVPWYQPVLDLRTGEIVGVEALARWIEADGSVSSPDTFIPLAEDSELIIDLDLSITRQALVDLAQLRRVHPQLRMGLNFSTRHLSRPGWVDLLCRMTSAAGIPPSAINVELTETRGLDELRDAGLVVRRLQRAGFQVWLDDFGTGWSSMEYLLRLPVDGVKIDRVVSLALGTRIGDAISRSTTGMCDELGLRTIIEGIETTVQAGQAAQLGCDLAQGHLWSAALPMAEITTLLESNRPSATGHTHQR